MADFLIDKLLVKNHETGKTVVGKIQNVAFLSAIPLANADSADFVSVDNELFVKRLENGVYSYSKVGGGIEYIDITDLDELPSKYRNTEILKTAILFDTDHLLRLTWIDDMYYFGNTDDFQYRYLSIDTNDWIIMRYDIQEIAKKPKTVNLNNSVPSSATSGTLTVADLTLLRNDLTNTITFNNEIFKLADNQHESGYLVYSHNGHDTTGCFFQKCITITIATRGWVLEEQENQAKLVSGTNIKTINGNSLLGSGNITIESGSSAEIITINFGALSNNMATATITTATYNKLVGADLVVVKAVVSGGSTFYLMPQIETGMKIYGMVIMAGAEKIGQFQMIPVSSSMAQLNYIEQTQTQSEGAGFSVSVENDDTLVFTNINEALVGDY